MTDRVLDVISTIFAYNLTLKQPALCAFCIVGRTHPSDRGHAMMAEALAGPLGRALATEAALAAGGRVPSRRRDARVDPLGVPPPMVPGNNESPSTVCAMQASRGGVQAGWSFAVSVGRDKPACAGINRRTVLFRFGVNCLPHATAGWRCQGAAPGQHGLPVTCPFLLQEDFQPMVVRSHGFKWRPERPAAPSFVEQKWVARCLGYGADGGFHALVVPS
jgi:hypothetical protein